MVTCDFSSPRSWAWVAAEYLTRKRYASAHTNDPQDANAALLDLTQFWPKISKHGCGIPCEMSRPCLGMR